MTLGLQLHCSIQDMGFLVPGQREHRISMKKHVSQ